MIHKRQHPNECVLASLAMLLDRDYEELRQNERARKHMQSFEWGEDEDGGLSRFGPTGEHWTDHTNKLHEELGIEKYPEYMKDGESCLPRHDKLDGRKVRGKGVLVLQWYNNDSHMVAFEDGIIYDPGMYRPRPLAEWLEYNGQNLSCWLRLRQVA